MDRRDLIEIGAAEAHQNETVPATGTPGGKAAGPREPQSSGCKHSEHA